MNPWGWATLGCAGFWMAVLGVLVSDGWLFGVGVIVFSGSTWVYGAGRDE